jgi:hypothetical protein
MDGAKPCDVCFRTPEPLRSLIWPGVFHELFEQIQELLLHILEARCCAYDLLTFIPTLSTDPVATEGKERGKGRSNPKIHVCGSANEKIRREEFLCWLPVSIECLVT